MTSSEHGQPENDQTPNDRSTRADLLPEEVVAGSENPQAQAEAILAESAERTAHPEAAESS